MRLQRRLFLFTAVLIFGAFPLLAAKNLTYTISGTLNPLISGDDPLSMKGSNAILTVAASESLTPHKSTNHTATYIVPTGAVSLLLGTTTYLSTTAASLEYDVPASGKDTVTVTTDFTVYGYTITTITTIVLKAGSFTNAALTHPQPFKPSPQDLKPGSQLAYEGLAQITVLGLAAQASEGPIDLCW